MKHLYYYNNFEQTNEGVKTWLSTFLLMANLGLVPLNIKAADSETKKEFVEKQPKEKVDAAKFFKFLDSYGFQRPMEVVWKDFIQTDSTVKSSYEDVQKYINRDGKVYHFDKQYQAQDFSNVDIHKFTPINWTTDMGNFYPDELEPNINNWISDYEKKTSIEIAVITVKSLDDMPIEYYGDEIFERIGIGKKGADNGILIIFSMDDRKSRIQTGYGMEQFLTDLQCSRILNNVIKPNFKEGKYYEGTMAALEAIRSELGDEAYANKVQWLKDKKAKEQRDWDNKVNEFWDTILSALIVSLLLSPFAYLIYRRHRNKKINAGIDAAIKEIEELRKQIPSSVDIKSDRLISALNAAKDISNKIPDVTVLGKDVKKEGYLENLKKYQELLDSSISDYQSKRSNIQKYVTDIKSWESQSLKGLQILGEALIAYEAIKQYGYSADKPADKQEVQKLSMLGSQAFDSLKTNVDSAINDYDLYISKLERVLSSGKSAISTLGSIKTAESELSRADSKIKSALDDMERYKRWGRSSEKDEVDNLVKSFKSSKADLLKRYKQLSELLSKIDDMRRKWKRRKEDEEEEEDRRRAAYSSSSSSSSSYDSGGSSFGGFGGGSSGSGGSSSGW